MQFADSETQRLLRSTARSYLANEYPLERLFRIERGEEEFGARDLAGLAELGWLRLAVPEEQGGGGASLLDAAVVIEELGYAAAPAPVAAATIAGRLLASAPRAGEPLAALVRGERLYTVAEANRRSANTTPPAVAGGRIVGTLPLVPFAAMSAYVLAPATIDGEAAFAALPLVGAEIEPVDVIDRRCYANVHFRQVPADGMFVLATGEAASELHEQCDVLSTALGLIELSGLLRRTLEMTAAHISTRQQFGQPIGKFQAARHRAAEILMQVETTRWAAYHALWRFENDPRDTQEIYLAKHWAVRAVDRVFQNSHMLHGGVGVTMEHPLHLYTQGIAAFAVRGGTMREMVERTVGSVREARAAR
jgi:alkylation response protein AidB-like acyl-CoA dehydrogenase